jgi:hypothetical protein
VLSHLPRPRRTVIHLALAVVLTGELAALAVGARIASAGSAGPNGDAAAPSRTEIARQGVGSVGWSDHRDRESGRNVGSSVSAAVGREPLSKVDVASAPPSLTAKVHETTTVQQSAASFKGRNRVWIPSLGINRSIAAFPCARSRPPDNLVYRWGCAGSNNIYLMAHSYGMFRPLHDAFVSGRLAKGMKVYYAGSDGRVRTFSVSWWKTARPTTSASWAWAPQSRSSMTLQTCVGSNSQYRLFVRLVETG